MSYISITYRQLNQKSQQLADWLKQEGVGADSIVGIMVERSLEMIIGIFGILKAGGAYLPLDPNYPEERIKYMLTDSSARTLLTHKDIVPSPSTLTSTCQVSPTNLAYIIYTSGSTGSPKGVMMQHSSAVNILVAMQREFPLEESDAYLLKTSYVFDVSVTELFGWFLGGARLVIMEKEGEKNPGKIMDTVERTGITHMNFVPSMFHSFTGELNPGSVRKLAPLKYIFLAGEALLPGVVNEFRQFNTSIVLENIYGPTEAAVYSSKYSLSGWNGSASIPIGKPMQNIKLFILDKDNRLQPIGIPGELCIGGPGLAVDI
jgi:amino acid adenylation domain-containing protein